MLKNRTDLRKMSFGCWYISHQAETRITGGSRRNYRTYWHAECTKCGHKFEIQTKVIATRLNFPNHCENCFPEIDDKRAFKYGRNQNGFIDKNIKIYLRGEK